MKTLHDLLAGTLEYIVGAQDLSAGEYYGAFWSEKAYHGPLLDWHGGGAHHHRGAASAALALWLSGGAERNGDWLARAEKGFDWLASRQHPRGGWFEIQNNEKPSDWERTGLEELSTISSAFAVHGLGTALLHGLPPKKSYMDCLLQAGHWFLSIERPVDSGIYPHHERSPYDTLNATAHAVESLALIYRSLDHIYGRRINIFLEGARRGFAHTLPLQWDNGCYPYRANGGATINYTSLVLWCFLNTLDILPKQSRQARWPTDDVVSHHLAHAAAFLRTCVDHDGTLVWDGNETSTAKHNLWTYAITANVLERIGGDANRDAADRVLAHMLDLTTPSGLLPMRDEGETITECLFMQADMVLFLQHLLPSA